MAQIQDISDLVNRLSGGSSGTPEAVFYHKGNRTGGTSQSAAPTIANRLTSLWVYNGHPASGPVPTAVEAPTNTSQGSLLQTDPGGGRQKWLVNAVCSTEPSAHGAVFFDRLLHIGGLSGTVTTPQTVGGTLTRYTGSESAGNQIFAEIYTIVGGTPTTITASYTNQAGTSGRTTEAVPFGGTGWREAQRLIRLPLQSGDTGVRSVESCTLAGTTGTAGNFGITIARQLVIFPMAIVSGSMRDYLSGLPSMPEVKPGACIFGAVHCNAASGVLEANAKFQFLEA